MLGDESLPTIYDGIDLQEIPFNDAPEDFFIIVGRMTPGKGIAEAIRIAKRAKVKLLIVGHITTHLPWSESYFLREVKPHVDGKQIRYIERLPYSQLMKWISRAKGFLFPLQWDEPFGMVVVEAMAAGTPVLSYRRGSMPELVEDGGTGYLLEDEDGFIEALTGIERLSRKRCRQWVEKNFSLERMVDSYERIYRSVV
jgi:glycosyltransferase involved in cell wall biosynthesis